MNADTFFQFFDLLAEAPNSVAKLRELILQLAVQGKLVAQSDDEEPASRLIGRIRKAKELLITSKAIKESAAHTTRNLDQSVYPIPSSWEWITLGEITDIGTGTTPLKADSRFYANGTVPWITSAATNDEFIKTPEQFVTKMAVEECGMRVYPAGSLVVALYGQGKTRGQVGQLEFDSTTNQACSVIVFFGEGIEVRDYCRLVLKKRYHEMRAMASGGAQPNLSGGLIRNTPIPIPPLAEQRRIVSKVDELLGLCDELETRQGARRELRERLVQAALDQLLASRDPADFATHWQRLQANFDILFDTPEAVSKLRQAILQLAVRGKLVEQRSTDKPAIKLLAEIKRDRQLLVSQRQIPNQKGVQEVSAAQVPYELPVGWMWARFGDACLYIAAGWSPKCEERPRVGDEWGILKISAVTWDRFNPDENKALPANLEPRPDCEVKAGDFLMSRANTAELVAKSVVVESTPPRLLLNDKVLRVSFPKQIDPSYINLVNNSPLSRLHYIRVASGTSDSMRNVSRENVLDMLIPIPPEQEQRRIVKKTNELLTMCEGLKKQFQSSAESVDRLISVAIQDLHVGKPGSPPHSTPALLAKRRSSS